VIAVNEGGESFPSEILSCSLSDNSKPTVLIVNGFDRIAPPAHVNNSEFAGFLNMVDQGVPYQYDIGFTGEQYNYFPSSKLRTDALPGHGSSYSDYETKLVAGNTFNYPYVHGKAIIANGYSFLSASDEAVFNNEINLNDYKIVDLIMGEEKSTNWVKEFSDSLLGPQYEIFNTELMNKISNYLDLGGKLFISGSYIGSDIFLKSEIDSAKRSFVMEKLKYQLDTDHAVKNGDVISMSDDFINKDFEFSFVTERNDTLYNAEAPDAIIPLNGSQTILRFSENNYSAATGYNGDYSVIAFGFPFETIESDYYRRKVMAAILEYIK